MTARCRAPGCHRPLTDPESVALGVGPDCARKLGLRAYVPSQRRTPGDGQQELDLTTTTAEGNAAMTVHNPNADPELNALLGLAVAMTAGPTAFIEGQERAGQAQLVNSDVLPTEINYGTRGDFEAVGFVFGAQVDGDPLFTHVTLPEGWTRQGSAHAMHSSIIDPLGRKRVSVFYKAAFYDRRADMSLVSVSSYAADCLNLWGDGGPTMPVFDDEWATRDAVVAALDDYADRERKEGDDWAARLVGDTPQRIADCQEYIDRHRDHAAKARAFAASVREGLTGARP